jgi:hypothetical protein
MEIVDARLLRNEERQRMIQDKESKIAREFAKIDQYRPAIETAHAEAEEGFIVQVEDYYQDKRRQPGQHWCMTCNRYHPRMVNRDGVFFEFVYYCPKDRQFYLSYNYTMRLGQSWLYDLHKKVGLVHVGAKRLLEYMLSIGLEDLRTKYGGQDSFSAMSGYQKASFNAKRDEEMLYAMMNPIFKCKKQVGIEYLLGDGKWHKGFMDLVCGSPNAVYILEVKASAGYINDEQLQKYHYSMCKILDKTTDRRNVVTVPIAFDTSETSPTKYATFQEVMRLRTLSEISGYFVKRAAYITHRRL